MGYPPFRSLVQILVTDESYMKAFQVGDRVAKALKSTAAGSTGDLHVLGPAPAPIERLRGKYRVQLLLKAPAHANSAPALREAFDLLTAQRVPLGSVRVDVDPLSLL
jgi:primosomal protein N' (replication factor Y)